MTAKNLPARIEKTFMMKQPATGKTWQVTEGGPTGCFTFPDDPTMYRIQDLVDFLKKNLKPVVFEDQNRSIQDGGILTFDDALGISGEVQPKKHEVEKIKKTKGKFAENCEKIEKALKTYTHSVTKKAIVAQTGLSIGVVTTTIAAMDNVIMSGKSGSQNLYKLKDR